MPSKNVNQLIELVIGSLAEEISERVAERVTKKLAAMLPPSQPPLPPPPPVSPFRPTEALVLTIKEAGKRTRLSRASLYRAMEAKQLRFLKYGTRRLIAKDDLDDFIKSLRV